MPVQSGCRKPKTKNQKAFLLFDAAYLPIGKENEVENQKLVFDVENGCSKTKKHAPFSTSKSQKASWYIALLPLAAHITDCHVKKSLLEGIEDYISAIPNCKLVLDGRCRKGTDIFIIRKMMLRVRMKKTIHLEFFVHTWLLSYWIVHTAENEDFRL